MAKIFPVSPANHRRLTAEGVQFTVLYGPSTGGWFYGTFEFPDDARRFSLRAQTPYELTEFIKHELLRGRPLDPPNGIAGADLRNLVPYSDVWQIGEWIERMVSLHPTSFHPSVVALVDKARSNLAMIRG